MLLYALLSNTVMLLIVLAVIIGILVIFFYNRFVRLKNEVESSFSTVDVFLKQRYDMIPNLVNTVKKYMQYEQETLEKIITLRNQAAGGNRSDALKTDAKITQQLAKIIALAENYPELKASEQFTNLSNAIQTCEREIAAGRRAYNACVTKYNTAIAMFPASIIAKLTGNKAYAWFETIEAERQPVSVQF